MPLLATVRTLHRSGARRHKESPLAPLLLKVFSKKMCRNVPENSFDLLYDHAIAASYEAQTAYDIHSGTGPP